MGNCFISGIQREGLQRPDGGLGDKGGPLQGGRAGMGALPGGQEVKKTQKNHTTGEIVLLRIFHNSNLTNSRLLRCVPFCCEKETYFCHILIRFARKNNIERILKTPRTVSSKCIFLLIIRNTDVACFPK